MDNQLSAEIKTQGLDVQRTQDLMKKFGVFYDEARKIAEESKDLIVSSEDQLDLMQTAREKRLELKNIRVAAEKVRKDLKEQSLREGRAIDGVANIIKALIVPVEQHLENQEKFADRIREEKELKIYQDRIDKLSIYVDNVGVYNLHPKDMSGDTFDQLIISSKTAYEAQRAAEKKSQEEREAREKEEALERDRIKEENEKLKRESLERDRIEAEEKRKQQAILDEERKKREEVEAKLKAEQEAQERKELALKSQAEADKKAKEESERQALLAPDKTKLMEYANSLVLVETPAVKSNDAQKIIDWAEKKLEEIANVVRNNAQKL